MLGSEWVAEIPLRIAQVILGNVHIRSTNVQRMATKLLLGCEPRLPEN